MLFMRHGQSTFNAAYDGQGYDPKTPDPALSPLGEQQAKQAAERLASRCKIAEIVSSPYRRAVQTALIVASYVNAPLRIDPLIRERAMYSCDVGSPVEVLQKEWPALDFSALPSGEWWLPFPESAASAQQRARQFEMEILGREPSANGKILAVSHCLFLYAATGAMLDNAEVIEV